MRAAPEASSFRPDQPFKLVGGDPSLDLVNTVTWTGNGLVNERLTDYERLTRWAEEAGLVPKAEARRLRRAAAARPEAAREAYDAARWLRWVLQRLYTSLATDEPAGSSWDEFNELLSEALRRLRLAPVRQGLQAADWSWRGQEESLDSVLWPILWSAAALLTSEEAERIRVCGAPDCGWVYVDRSRNGLRRWCEMETCGTQEKSRRRRQKE
ncbi:MAG TPA: ABATE domain-containing protein [Thermoanaerobaculia bacterium]